MQFAVRSLRVRFAALTFLAIYGPVVLLFAVIRAQDTSVETVGGTRFESTTVDVGPSTATVVTVIALAPFAVALAWWLSGLAVRPIEAAVDVQRRLVEEASHELRTPLAVLSNNAEVLLTHPNPDLATYREGIERSGQAADRMGETIDALLVDARGRARTVDRKPTDVAALCRSVVDELSGRAGRAGVTVSMVAPAKVRAPVDEPSMKRAVTNLVTNAIQHAPGSSVQVEIAVGDDVEGRDELTIVVVDDGPGVPATNQARIFDRFWTAAEDGTGLGLPIARQIVEAHGGSLLIDSPVADGRGTKFTVRLHR